VCRDDISQRSEACVPQILIFDLDHMEIDSELNIYLNMNPISKLLM